MWRPRELRAPIMSGQVFGPCKSWRGRPQAVASQEVHDQGARGHGDFEKAGIHDSRGQGQLAFRDVRDAQVHGLPGGQEQVQDTTAEVGGRDLRSRARAG